MTNMPQQQPGQPPAFTSTGAPVPPAKPKKPWFKKWWVWVLALIIIVGVGNGLGKGGSGASAGAQQSAGSVSTTTTQAPPAKAKLTLDDGWTMDKSTKYAVYINGYVTNNTDKAITNYVQITFDALDKSGANLGTCLANTNTIDAGGKWKFKAICTSQADEVAQVRFKEITGF